MAEDKNGAGSPKPPRSRKPAFPSAKQFLKLVIDPKTPGKAQIVHLPISCLKFLERNPNKMSPQDLADLRDSLETFSAVEPAVINLFPGREFIIVGGNHRVQGAQEMNWPTFPCVFVYLDADQEMKLVLRLKKNQGKFDDDILRSLPIEMLEDSGFHETDLESLFGKEQKPGAGPGNGNGVEIERQDIRPYNKTHILLSFTPDVLVFIKPHLEQILKIAGVEYEQSSN